MLEKDKDILIAKNNELNIKVNNLLEENIYLKNKLNDLELKLENINNIFNNKIKELNDENENLKDKINKIENYLEKKQTLKKLIIIDNNDN